MNLNLHTTFANGSYAGMRYAELKAVESIRWFPYIDTKKFRR